MSEMLIHSAVRVCHIQKCRMDDTVTDILQCEEQLRTTLHCEDKDKVLPTKLHTLPYRLPLILCVVTEYYYSFAGSCYIYKESTAGLPRDYRLQTFFQLTLTNTVRRFSAFY